MHAHTKENVVVIDKLLLRQQDELVRKMCRCTRQT